MNTLELLDLKNKHRLELCKEILKDVERFPDIETIKQILRGQIVALTTMLQDRDAKP